MAKNKVEITGINTSTLRSLTHEEMTLLFKSLKKGDNESKRLLVEGNLKLVLSILKRYQNKCDNLDDLFQIGVVGLIKAVDNFDLSFNVRFSTYAVFMIEGEIKRYIRDNNQVRISRSIKELAYQIINYKEECMHNNNVYPSNEEICKKFNITDYDLYVTLSSLGEPMSIFEPIYNDGGDTIYLLDQLEDASIKDLDKLLSLREAIDKIKDKERTIIMRRYFYGMSQSEIASELKISQAQVSRIENNALNSIKKLML